MDKNMTKTNLQMVYKCQMACVHCQKPALCFLDDAVLLCCCVFIAVQLFQKNEHSESASNHKNRDGETKITVFHQLYT